VLLLNWNIF